MGATWVTKAGATINADAPSPDGDYTLATDAEDIKENLTTGYGRVRVDNFEQLDGIRSTHADAFKESPFYHLPSETARVNPDGVWLGDDVETMAEQMLAAVEVTAYLLPHRTWTQNDRLDLDDITRETYLTDAAGVVDWSWFWKADRAGVFDIIFDYDGDRVFSYSLDPLIGFQVIPEPLTVLTGFLSTTGLVGYVRRRIRRRS